LLTSSSVVLWPPRNIAAYGLHTALQARIGMLTPAGTGGLQGCVRGVDGEAVPGATVLVSERDGSTHTATSDASGCYRIAEVPAGRYVPVAGAAGYQNQAVYTWGQPLWIGADEQRALDITLTPLEPLAVPPGSGLELGEPQALSWDLPQPSRATRREIRYHSQGQTNQPTYLYTPLTTTQRLPTLLAVYPGPVLSWEGVSIPLAAAGYAVIGLGPEYRFDLGKDLREMRQLLTFARAGELPGADGRRIAALGGSYSSLHVQQLLQRKSSLCAAVLLGPPSDLFDMRRRFEEGSIFPPYGLDQALIALGTPDTSPERYWRYSFRYHLRPDMPPLLLMHSRSDEIIPFQQSHLLAAELERIGARFEMHVFEGMPHYLLAEESSDSLQEMYDLTLDFLQRQLQPSACAPAAGAPLP
jgi:dipeptidyl aminopeptidase/acylaminoacyl peptidase